MCIGVYTLFVQDMVCVGNECSVTNLSEDIPTEPTPPSSALAPAKTTPRGALTGKDKQVTSCTS